MISYDINIAYWKPKVHLSSNIYTELTAQEWTNKSIKWSSDLGTNSIRELLTSRFVELSERVQSLIIWECACRVQQNSPLQKQPRPQEIPEAKTYVILVQGLFNQWHTSSENRFTVGKEARLQCSSHTGQTLEVKRLWESGVTSDGQAMECPPPTEERDLCPCPSTGSISGSGEASVNWCTPGERNIQGKLEPREALGNGPIYDSQVCWDGCQQNRPVFQWHHTESTDSCAEKYTKIITSAVEGLEAEGRQISVQLRATWYLPNA